jgi:tetratricopeptide (TPR) repeat protein
MSSQTLTDLEQAVGTNPANADLRYLLAAQYAEEGLYEPAAKEFEQAIALNPDAHTARLQLGLLHLTNGNVQQALSSWGPLEALPDGLAAKLFKRGLEAMIRDDFTASARLLNEGIACNLTNPALNEDMRRVLSRFPKKPASAPAAAAPDTDKVRTDFSLYGAPGTTRH